MPAIKVMDLRWEEPQLSRTGKKPKKRISGPNSKKEGAPHDHQKAAPGVHSAWSQVQS